MCSKDRDDALFISFVRDRGRSKRRCESATIVWSDARHCKDSIYREGANRLWIQLAKRSIGSRIGVAEVFRTAEGLHGGMHVNEPVEHSERVTIQSVDVMLPPKLTCEELRRKRGRAFAREGKERDRCDPPLDRSIREPGDPSPQGA